MNLNSKQCKIIDCFYPVRPRTTSKSSFKSEWDKDSIMAEHSEAEETNCFLCKKALRSLNYPLIILTASM